MLHENVFLKILLILIRHTTIIPGPSVDIVNLPTSCPSDSYEPYNCLFIVIHVFTYVFESRVIDRITKQPLSKMVDKQTKRKEKT